MSKLLVVHNIFNEVPTGLFFVHNSLIIRW